MSTVPIDVRPDRDDDRALQAWVDVVADGIPLRLLLDTGSSRTAVPHTRQFALSSQTLTDAGYGASGTATADPLVRTGPPGCW